MNIFKKLNIQKRLVIFFLIISTVPILVVGMFSYIGGKNSVDNTINDFSNQLIKQMNTNVNSKVSKLEAEISTVYNDKEFLKAVVKEKKDYKHEFDMMTDISNMGNALVGFGTTVNEAKGVFLYRPKNNNTFIGTGSEEFATRLFDKFIKNKFEKTSYFKDAMSNPDGVWITGLYNDYNKIIYIKKIVDQDNPDKEIVIAFVFEPEIFDEVIGDTKSSKSNSSLFVMDSKKKKLISGNKISNDIIKAPEFINNVFGKKSKDVFSLNGKLISFNKTDNGWITVLSVDKAPLTKGILVVGIWTIVIGIICVLAAFFISTKISLGISRPVKYIMGLMKEVEEGNLKVVSNLKNADEIGKLSNSFNNMTKNVNNLVVNSTKKAVEVGNSSRAVNEIASQTVKAVQEICLAMDSISKGTNEEVIEVQKTKEIMDQLSEKINFVSDEVYGVTGIVNNAQSAGDESIAIVGGLNKKTAETLEIADIIKSNVDELSLKTRDIIKVINIIDDISEQTNLLSLNAAIEAARAGEYGKGFGVVADEVRKLAEQSKDSTKMIAEIIKNVQSNIDATVKIVDKANNIFREEDLSVKSVDEGVNRLIASMNLIIEKVDKVNNAVSDMDRHKNNAVHGVESIVSITELTASSTQQIMASTEEEMAAAQELASLAENLLCTVNSLNDEISKFKV